MYVNPNRPVEELVGANRGIVRQRLANIHCMTSILGQARAARPRSLRSIPVALRRGWALCVLQSASEFRGTFVAVTSGNFGHEQSVTVWS